MEAKSHFATDRVRARFASDFNRMFLNAIDEAERERAAYARHLNGLDPHDPVPTFAQWQAAVARRGNTEGQNHD